ncbi:hypothetical protein RclHR1_20670002 [Rhizophagus clarus]|uniref:Uncharacterized protein n=1 Tax=Rhizophagus clarus TaxID=94130 RepID=A0A2Z6QWB6_9GLOM|nr:hypothetical protein RclHR1_20670002 [Rhizophagus clarus]GET03301.1 hypothetical protein GLOIN_2v1835733 [Rhizophagus clarus]
MGIIGSAKSSNKVTHCSYIESDKVFLLKEGWMYSPVYSENIKLLSILRHFQCGVRNDDVVMIRNIENVSKQLKHQKEESALCAEEKRLIRMKNALWKYTGPLVDCIRKGNKPVSIILNF